MSDVDATERAAREQVAGIDMPAPGEEPAFLPHPLLDALLEAVVALGGELWIERDRRLALEALLEKHGVIPADELENWQPDAEQRAARTEELQALTARVLGPLKKLGAELPEPGTD